jgi:phosphoglycerate dehydrogenase-like enzyme
VTNAPEGVELVELRHLVQQCRVVVIATVPSAETQELMSAELINDLQPGALVILISRAWCADFPALIAAADKGRIRVATDVFPDEPVPADDPLRTNPNVILSPHRAAAVRGGRHLIGDMIVHDINAILNGTPDRHLKQADLKAVEGLIAAQNQIQQVGST